jgi:flagellar motility protein MotE (MotC chaperone)
MRGALDRRDERLMANTRINLCGRPPARSRANGYATGWLPRMVLGAACWLLADLPSPALFPAAVVAEANEPSAARDAAADQAGGPPSEATAQPGLQENANEAAPVQGPALTVPREIIDMLDQRKRDLDRREASLRGGEERLLALKAELEQIVAKHERLAAEHKQRGEESQQREQERKLRQGKAAGESRNQHQAQLAKIYEAMPAEEAAASLERMPERKAVEVLRILKSKSAGAILAAVRPERAARLTEQLLAAP